MEDEQFSLIAPSIIQNVMQSINNPEDKLSLVQTLNANGATVEEFTAAFVSLIEAIDTIEDLSEPKKDFLKQLFGCFVNAVNETEGVAKKYIQVPIELCHPEAKIPQYANLTDSGMDVYALDDYTIAPGETKLIPTGIKMAIPVGYEIQVRPKSGRALKTKLRIANTPGTVDAGYRDEIMVIVENIESPIKDITYEFNSSGQLIITSILHGSAHTIGKGEKFCQLVLMEVPKAVLYQVNSVSEIGENRGGGFGSTGLV
jgi:dUTP pyrophosphatase